MADRKPFLLRLDPEVHEALQRWARDELRSVNAQVEFLVRRALQQEGRLPRVVTTSSPAGTTARTKKPRT